MEGKNLEEWFWKERKRLPFSSPFCYFSLPPLPFFCLPHRLAILWVNTRLPGRCRVEFYHGPVLEMQSLLLLNITQLRRKLCSNSSPKTLPLCNKTQHQLLGNLTDRFFLDVPRHRSAATKETIQPNNKAPRTLLIDYFVSFG